jgi:hypothetical protein
MEDDLIGKHEGQTFMVQANLLCMKKNWSILCHDDGT